MSTPVVTQAASQVAKAARRVTTQLHGVVVSAGLMQKTVKVRVGGQKWNKIVNKSFSDPKQYLVHDPNDSLRTGDVVAIVPGWPTSQHKRHVVKHIIAPYGTPIEERPPVPSLEERIAERDAKKSAKVERKQLRLQAALEAATLEASEKDRKKKMKKKLTKSERLEPPSEDATEADSPAAQPTATSANISAVSPTEMPAATSADTSTTSKSQ